MKKEGKQLAEAEMQESGEPKEIAKQEPEETPEQKKQREFKKNVQHILSRLEEHLAIVKAREKLHVDLGKTLEQDILMEIPPARTWQTMKEEMERKGLTLRNLRGKMKKLSLRARGVKNVNELQPFIYYVETYLKKIEDRHVTVENVQLEKKIEEYKAQGYKVDFSHPYKKENKNSYLRISKQVPCKVPFRDIKRFSEHLNQGSDLIELLERFQHFGFEIDGFILEWQFDYVKKFMSSPSANEALRKIDAAGIKSGQRYFGQYHKENPEPFLEFVEDEQARNLFTPETIKRIKNFEQYFGKAIEISNTVSLKDVAQTFSNPDCLELLTFIINQNDTRFNNADPYSILRRMSALQRAGVAPELTAITKKNFLLGKRIYESLLDNFYSTEQVKSDFENNVSSESTKKLLEDEELSRFTGNFIAAADINESNISPQSFNTFIGEIEKFKDNPNALVLLQLAKEWNLPLEPKSWSSWDAALNVFAYLIRNETMEVLVKPEFNEFVKNLKVVFSRNLHWGDLISMAGDVSAWGRGYGHRWLLSLFYDDKFRERLKAQDFIETADYFSKIIKFNENEFFYLQLSEIPNCLEIIKDLEKKFHYRFQKEDCSAFVEFSASYDHRLALPLDEKTVRYYEQLKAMIGYEFALKDWQTLHYQAQDESFKKLLLNPEALPVIKAMVPSGLSNLNILRDIDAKLYALIPTLLQEFSLAPTYDFFHSTLPYISEHQEVVLRAARKLKACGFTFNMTSQLENVKEVGEQGLTDLFATYKDQPKIQEFIFEHPKEIGSIGREKLADYIEIFLKINESPSQEVQRLKESLLQELLNTDNPIWSYTKIEDVFIKNNLPTVGKVFKIFQILYPPYAMEAKLRRGSPVLAQAKTRGRYYIIYQDLLKTHVESASRSLRQYVEVLLSGEKMLQKVDQKGFDNLNEREQAKLKYFLDKVTTLFINSALGKNISGEGVKSDASLQERYFQLRSSLAVQEGQKLTERIGKMFLKPIGFERLDEVLERMQQKKFQAHQRGLALVADNQLQFQAGDLLKGIDVTFISNILQNGSVATEFLGASSGSDATPFDTDVSMVLPEDEVKGFEGVINNSLAPTYGQLLLAVKDRGQFQRTTIDEKTKRDPEKLELFATGGGRHYGIRTGFPSTEIDFMVAQEGLMNETRSLEKVFYEIAQNGYYIPITDKKGEVIFTPQMYEEYRRTFDGLERFDARPFVFKPIAKNIPCYNQIEEIVVEKERDEEKISTLSETIRTGVQRALGRAGVISKKELDSNILGAELLDIGSTGRRTNMPGDYDFDFTLKLDSKDFQRASEIAQQIKIEFVAQKDESHAEQSGYYQLRVIGVSEISGQKLEKPIDIDIGFTSKSELSVFGSHDAITEKFAWIEQNISQEAREQVIANIILCKRVLKEGYAYKRVEDGGFGGIGVENWILAHNGNIIEAFQSFRDAAHENEARVPFENFKEKYKIFNAGMNVKRLFHDNYIENLKPEGYQKMLDVIDRFLDQLN